MRCHGVIADALAPFAAPQCSIHYFEAGPAASFNNIDACTTTTETLAIDIDSQHVEVGNGVFAG